MEQSHSWQANRSSVNEETPSILWNQKVHYCIQKRPPSVLILARPASYRRISPSPVPSEMFRNIKVLWSGLVSTSTISKLVDHPLSAPCDCLFNTFAANLHIWNPLLHSQPEDVLCSCDRNPAIADCKVIIFNITIFWNVMPYSLVW
jgi:hypothetical protein